MRRRECADDVERDPTEELGVGSLPRWFDAQDPKLGENLAIDCVARRYVRDGDDSSCWHRHPRRGEPVVVRGHDGRVARAESLDLSVRQDQGNGIVANAEVAEWCDIRFFAIGKPGDHRESAGATGPFEVQFARTDFDPLNSRERRVAPGPLGDPGVNDPILPRVDLEPLAPFVGHLAGRLLQDEAAFGIDDVNSSAEGAASERGVIARGVVAEEAQVEAPPPLKRPVTRPGVAAEPTEQAGNMAVEIDVFECRSVGQRQWFRLRRPQGPDKEDQNEPHDRLQNRTHGSHLIEICMWLSFRLHNESDLLGLALVDRELAAVRLETISLGNQVELEVRLELTRSKSAVLLLFESNIGPNAAGEDSLSIHLSGFLLRVGRRHLEPGYGFTVIGLALDDDDRGGEVDDFDALYVVVKSAKHDRAAATERVGLGPAPADGVMLVSHQVELDVFQPVRDLRDRFAARVDLDFTEPVVAVNLAEQVASKA